VLGCTSVGLCQKVAKAQKSVSTNNDLVTFYSRFSIDRWRPFLGLKMTSAKRGISEGVTVDLRWNLLRTEDTITFSSIKANL
jgi:hypothetical protein